MLGVGVSVLYVVFDKHKKLPWHRRNDKLENMMKIGRDIVDEMKELGKAMKVRQML